MNLKNLKVCAGVLALLGWASPALAATSITQFGITWTFDRDYPAGQYANGDWWVVGPVTITRITPYDTDGVAPHMHGSMINPIGGGDNNGNTIHGFDSRIGLNIYNHSLNVAASFPRVVPNGSSLISSKGFTDSPKNPQIEVMAILTVVSSAPPAGSFRPPYMGTDKTPRWNKSSIDYSKLRSLAPVAGTPALSTVESHFEKPFIQIGRQYNYAGIHGYWNVPWPGSGYGREINRGMAEGALVLNLNYTNAQKERLAIRMIQWGIDIYGALLNGMSYPGSGGFNMGRKLPMLMAGVLLNDPNIIDRANGTKYRNYFSEDQQHFTVSQYDIDTPRVPPCCGRAYAPYTQDMLGMSEWTGNYVTFPTSANAVWGTEYRHTVGGDSTAHALAAHLMGLEKYWNWPPFFDYYAKRFFPIESKNAYDMNERIKVYVKNMWLAYWNSSPTSDGSATSIPTAPLNLTIIGG